MFCGTSSLKHVDEDRRTPPSPPRLPPKAKKASKNPYSTRGLDKYSTLVAELDARKAKIMEAVGSQDQPTPSTTTAPPPMVWFVYSSSGDCTPVVVRLREDHHRLEDEKRRPPLDANKPLPLPPPAERNSEAAVREASTKPQPPPPDAGAGRVAAAVVKGWRSWKEWRPSYLLPWVLVLILVWLLIFGRVFAICCTSIWWYWGPLMEDSEHQRIDRRNKKDYRRRLSDGRKNTALVAQARRQI